MVVLASNLHLHTHKLPVFFNKRRVKTAVIQPSQKKKNNNNNNNTKNKKQKQKRNKIKKKKKKQTEKSFQQQFRTHLTFHPATNFHALAWYSDGPRSLANQVMRSYAWKSIVSSFQRRPQVHLISSALQVNFGPLRELA